ncbi:AAA family ATPase [Mucilaginibacter mali]|uniref:AAA family ATPase n=1 Tax=Mucilaginibacter mali TaxID=2740462 RepID=A0A7D4QCL7_9SPHI|nr:AAA family ATPase [Mucilaginibacter mali]QKJ28312.1 AAA family ATPase [Mucilaginibacter mali]
MELKEFFKLILKYKYVIIIVPLVTIIVTHFLVKRLPLEFVSTGRMATGIVDQSRQLLDPIASTLQDAAIAGKFSNLEEVMRLKKMMDMVSYNLILHDLTTNKPFRPQGKDYVHFNKRDSARAVPYFKDKLAKLEPLNLHVEYDKWLNDMLIEKRYDQRSLEYGLGIKRDGDSDFMSVSIDTENPELSAFIVNTLIQGFIAYHTASLKETESGAINYLSDMMKQKRKILKDKQDSLLAYRVAHSIMNIDDQSRTISSQMSANDERLLQANKDAESYRGAIDNIDQKFDPNERKYIEANVTKLNIAVSSTRDKMHELSDKYVRSNFDKRIKVSLDSIQKVLTEQMNQTSDQYILNPLVGKDELRRRKNELEVSYDLARYSIQLMEDQQRKLKSQYDKLVPLDARLKSFYYDIDNASHEYQEALSKYNLTNLQSASSSKLIQVQVAMPEPAEPSKKMLLVILSGFVSGFAVLMVLFVMFFLDDSIKNPTQLANATQIPVLGYLNLVSGNTLDLRKLWDVENRDKMAQFKDLLRAIRFEIDQELDGEKVVAITSMKGGEGKTLLAISLAYSYSMINKKVLLIDGNFENPTISKTVNPKLYVEDVFKNTPGSYDTIINTNSVMGNHGGDVTLLEIGDERFIRQKLNELKSVYDVIIIETPSLDEMNKAKEWLLFTNKFIAVFEAGQSIVNGKKALVKYLQGAGDKFAGWVLNKSAYNIKKKKR